MTDLMKEDAWLAFPKETFTPLEKIVKVVNMLIHDVSIYGKAVEIQGSYHGYRG